MPHVSAVVALNLDVEISFRTGFRLRPTAPLVAERRHDRRVSRKIALDVSLHLPTSWDSASLLSGGFPAAHY